MCGLGQLHAPPSSYHNQPPLHHSTTHMTRCTLSYTLPVLVFTSAVNEPSLRIY